jgi:uncharacterized RDD family membrane protein YckC
MNCQHCQTWILDDDHRCSRCGRRVRSSPAASVEQFPVSTGATAHAYDFAPSTTRSPVDSAAPQGGQPALFSNPNPDRVIAFESLTTPAGRQSIRVRAAGMNQPATGARPEPLKQTKVELPRPRNRKKVPAGQQSFELFGEAEIVASPQSNIICDAPVAPVTLRMEAAVIDGALMLTSILAGLAMFLYQGGSLTLDKHNAVFWLAALLTIPVLYKTLWACAGQDSVGMTFAGLRLVDFDGNPPSLERRYHRLFGSFISILAAGIGLVWALVDEDGLTWHDHISNTFPTIAAGD